MSGCCIQAPSILRNLYLSVFECLQTDRPPGAQTAFRALTSHTSPKQRCAPVRVAHSPSRGRYSHPHTTMCILYEASLMRYTGWCANDLNVHGYTRPSWPCARPPPGCRLRPPRRPAARATADRSAPTGHGQQVSAAVGDGDGDGDGAGGGGRGCRAACTAVWP